MSRRGWFIEYNHLAPTLRLWGDWRMFPLVKFTRDLTLCAFTC